MAIRRLLSLREFRVTTNGVGLYRGEIKRRWWWGWAVVTHNFTTEPSAKRALANWIEEPWNKPWKEVNW